MTTTHLNLRVDCILLIDHGLGSAESERLRPLVEAALRRELEDVTLPATGATVERVGVTPATAPGPGDNGVLASTISAAVLRALGNAAGGA